MWCLETIKQINKKAVELAKTGKERDALSEVGIVVPTREDSFVRENARTQEILDTAKRVGFRHCPNYALN